MAKIKPFKGIFYAAKNKISQLVSPPYDEISPEAEKVLKGKDPYNITHIILPDKSNYQQAADLYRKWKENNILISEGSEAFYVYEQTFIYKEEKRRRLGFFALTQLEDPREKIILPHEKTFSLPKQDRLELMKTTKVNLEPIFGLYSDGDFFIDKFISLNIEDNSPLFDFSIEDGVRHRFWKINQKDKMEKLSELLKDKMIFIADGHHRYEESKNLREEMERLYGEAPKGYNYVLMYFSNMEDEDLTIFSIHRLLRLKSFNFENFSKEAKAYFAMEKISTFEELFKVMDLEKNKLHLFGLYTGKNNFYLLRYLKSPTPSSYKNLDVTIMHTVLIEHLLGISDEEDIRYTRDDQKAKDLVDKGEFDLAVFLNPTRIEEIKEIASSFKVMPHKSTYFYPKILSGLVLREIE